MRFLLLSCDESVISIIHTTMAVYGSFDIADSIPSAMEYVKNSKGRPYQAVFADMDLRDGAGLDFIRQLREFEGDRRNYATAVILTCDKQIANTMNYFADVKDRYISKPVSRPELHEILKELII